MMQKSLSVPYHKNKVYEPKISNEAFCHCWLERVAGGEKCEFCSSALYQSIEGLGVNSMQGRKAKHVRFAQYAKHATLSSRWVLVFRHDYITGMWLRMQDPSSVPYHKNKGVYKPKISNKAFCHWGLERVAGGEKCEFCLSALYQSIERSV